MDKGRERERERLQTLAPRSTCHKRLNFLQRASITKFFLFIGITIQSFLHFPVCPYLFTIFKYFCSILKPKTNTFKKF